MKYLPSSIFIFLLVWPGVFSNQRRVHQEWRASCTGAACGGQSQKSEVSSESHQQRIIPGGIIDPRPPIEPPQPSQFSIRTCPQCINICSSRCSNSFCLNSCLSSCDCSGRFSQADAYSTNFVEQNSVDAINNNNCCHVMHPKQCYTEETGNKRCFIRRHKECSDLCTSSVVTIQERERQQEDNRQQEGGRGCQYIQNYPYVYCGNYERQNCGQCYNCNGGYNPKECSRKSECSESCRRSIPSCVRTSGGTYCNN